MMEAHLKCGSYDTLLELLMLEGQGIVMMESDWLHVVWLDWQAQWIAKVSTKPALREGLLQKYSQLYGTDQGTMENLDSNTHCSTKCQVTFFRPRPVPLVLKEPSEWELDNLEEARVVESLTIVIGLLD